MYDWDEMVWRGNDDESKESELFRDDTHPSPAVSLEYARFLTRTRTQRVYSKKAKAREGDGIGDKVSQKTIRATPRLLTIPPPDAGASTQRLRGLEKSFLSRRLTVVIKTFRRKQSLLSCLRAIRRRLGKHVQVVVANDGGDGLTLEDEDGGVLLPVVVVELPFDVGLSRGRNEGVTVAETDYVLVLDDDVEIESSSSDLVRLISAMDASDVDVIGGEVGNDAKEYMTYAGDMRQVGSDLYLTSSSTHGDGSSCPRHDLVPNVLLARRATLLSHQWDERLKVGEHEDFFLRAKIRGLAVFYCGTLLRARHRQVRTREYMQYRGREHLYSPLFLSKVSTHSLCFVFVCLVVAIFSFFPLSA